MNGSHPGAMGLVGFLSFLAGLHLLWQGRHEVIFWMDEFSRIFRGEFTKRAGTSVAATTDDAAISAKRYRGTLRLIAAFGLMMLGPLLFLIDLRY
jgi:hypothetical protein